MERTEKVDKIIDRLFNPQLQVNDAGCRYARSLKYRYISCYLNAHWEEVVGGPLSKSCRAERIERGTLYVRTDSSMLASQLFMMKSYFLGKVNAVLAGKLLLKDARFNSGRLGFAGAAGAAKKAGDAEKSGKSASEKKQVIVRCASCGARTLAPENTGAKALCSICARSERQRQAERLRELLQAQPWLSYEKALTYLPDCDKIIFTAEKEQLQGFYCEKVRLGHADALDEQMAVMLLTGREPDKIDGQQWENALRHLRRNAYVPASGVRLHGEKQ